MPTPTRKRNANTTFRRPQCTHVDMDRAYGPLTCHVCGQIPDMGWLYRCRQDYRSHQNDDLPDLSSVPTPPDNANFYDASARVAEHLNMSSSVVNGIRAHRYRPHQVNHLIKQKQHLINVINEVKRCSAKILSSPSKFPLRHHDGDHSIIGSVGATPCVSIQPAQQTLDLAASLNDGHRLNPGFKCNFQVCHTCRPFCLDKLYSSFESILSGEISYLDHTDLHTRPLINLSTASTIGLRQVSSKRQSSSRSKYGLNLTTHNLDDDSDDISVDWTPTTIESESESGSQHAEKCELHPRCGTTNCPMWRRCSICALTSSFEDGRRASSHKFLATEDLDQLNLEHSHSDLGYSSSNTTTTTPGGASSTASSLSLPTPKTAPRISLLPMDNSCNITPKKQMDHGPRAQSACDRLIGEHNENWLRKQKSCSSFGGEVEVHGGVALTEEAVKSNSPDIFTMH